MQHAPCQRGVTLLWVYIQPKRTALLAEFSKELTAVCHGKNQLIKNSQHNTDPEGGLAHVSLLHVWN